MTKRSPWRLIWGAADLRRRLLITLGILVLYRLAAQIPVPGVNRDVVAAVMSGRAPGTGFLQLLNFLSGGTLSQFSILAMGVYPFITAEIILQVLVPIVPQWKARFEEDPREGQRWLERWAYVLAVPIAALQAFGQIRLFTFIAGGVPVLSRFGFQGANLLYSLAVIVSMTAGTMFAIWLGQIISEYGIRRQGISIIIFAGIVSQLPYNFINLIGNVSLSALMRGMYVAISLIVLIATIFLIVVVYQGQRVIPVMYPSQRIGRRMSLPVKGTLPLPVNMAGMIPLIFASSLLALPGVFASVFLTSKNEFLANLAIGLQRAFDPGVSGFYWFSYFVLVVLFTFFYTEVLFLQQNYGEQLRRAGARIPGVLPGDPTQRYLTRVLRRITIVGALFLGFVAILPYLLTLLIPQASQGGYSALMLMSASGLIIVVGVVRDLVYHIEGELRMHGYDEHILVR